MAHQRLDVADERVGNRYVVRCLLQLDEHVRTGNRFYISQQQAAIFARYEFALAFLVRVA